MLSPDFVLTSSSPPHPPQPILTPLVLSAFLSSSEVPETEAQDSKCLREYGGNVGFSFCAPRIFPSFCYQRCRQNKGAKGGRCRSGKAGAGGVTCLCDFCSDKP